jgi:hypothetical protein
MTRPSRARLIHRFGLAVLFAALLALLGSPQAQRALADDSKPAIPSATQPKTTSSSSPEPAATPSTSQSGAKPASPAAPAPAPLAAEPARLDEKHTPAESLPDRSGDLSTSAVSQPSSLACNGSSNNWTTTSGSFTTITSCSLTLPITGSVFLSGNASVGMNSSNILYEGLFALGVDGVSIDATRRWVNIYSDNTDGTDENMATNWVVTLGPGVHSLSLQAKLYNGSGASVQIFRGGVRALYIPQDSDLLTCQSPGMQNWQGSQTTLQQITSCSLTVPTAGTVYLAATASGALASGGAAYEGLFSLGLDGSVISDSRRWLNIETDSADGNDRSVATSLTETVSPGAHTFEFYGAVNSGSGPLKVYYPSISAIFVPSGAKAVGIAASPAVTSWQNSTTSFTQLTSATLTLPVTSTVFIDANASVALAAGGNNYEGRFALAVDGNRVDSTYRWVNIYTDSSDGTDRTEAVSYAATVGPGTHTFSLQGHLYSSASGSGPAEVYNPSLVVIALNPLPSVSAVADQTTFENVPVGPLALTVGSTGVLSNQLTVTARSSDQTILPDSSIAVGGSGADRTVLVTPQIGKTGTVTITLSVSDGAFTSTSSFALAIKSAKPTVSAIASQTTLQNQALGPLALIVGSPRVPPDLLTVAGISSDQSIVSDSDITIGGNGADRTVTVMPSGKAGAVTITLSVTDNGVTATSSFVLMVQSSQPAVSPIANQTSVAGKPISLAMTISSVRVPVEQLTVTASSSDQSLMPDSNIVISGSGATRTLQITPKSGKVGTVTITLTVSDGVFTSTSSFTVMIVPSPVYLPICVRG